jgi:hypothetical protein
LAALVDFKMTKAHQPVLLAIGTGNETYYLQYNRAKGFNNETRSFKNWVTIHTSEPDDDRNASRILGAIRPNEFAINEGKGSIRLPLFTATNYAGSGRDLLIQVCADRPGNEKRRPDVMVISVGMGETLCDSPSEDDEEGDSVDHSSMRTPSSSSAKASPAPRPMKKKRMKRTKAPATATPSEAPKKRMMRRTKAPALVTTATPSESPLTKEATVLRRPSHSPTTDRPSPSPITSSPSVSPATASPTRDVPGGSSPRPFLTTGSTQDSYSYMYVISLLLAALGAWGVFVFIY